MLRRWFHRVVLARRWLTFFVMGLAFFVFGTGTVNLFFVLQANWNFLAEHGWDAVADGGLQQLAELLVLGYVSLAAYVLFKSCENALVHHLCDRPPDPQTARSRQENPHEDRHPAR
jgi:hypothetical protein